MTERMAEVAPYSPRVGERIDRDMEVLDRLIEWAEDRRSTNPHLTHSELCRDVGYMLDNRNINSPSTNGLLAIAIVRLLPPMRAGASRRSD